MTLEQNWKLQKMFAEAVTHYQIEGGIAKTCAFDNAIADFYTDGPLIAAALGSPAVKASDVLEWAKLKAKGRK